MQQSIFMIKLGKRNKPPLVIGAGVLADHLYDNASSYRGSTPFIDALIVQRTHHAVSVGDLLQMIGPIERIAVSVFLVMA